MPYLTLKSLTCNFLFFNPKLMTASVLWVLLFRFANQVREGKVADHDPKFKIER